MPTVVQFRRGNTTQNNNFTGAIGEISVDTTLNVLRVADGSTAGGFALVGQSASQTITNKIYQGSIVSVTGNITSGNLLVNTDAVITGNLTVNGTTITVNSNTVTINDKFINVANNASTSTLADGGGIGVGPVGAEYAKLEYDQATNTWNTNIGISITGNLSATGNITGGNFVGTLNGSGANVTAISATNISSGTLNQARLANSAVTLGSTSLVLGATVTTIAGLTSITSNTFVGALTGAATTAGTVTTAAQPNITSVGTLTTVSVTGNVTGGNVRTAGLISATGSITGSSLTVGTGNITAGNIVNGNANGVGNIGSSTTYYNTVFAKATSAQYADLAEMYVADQNYLPGTVVIFGGSHEITSATHTHSAQIAGVISTNPSYLMNSAQEGAHVLPVALTGRVPCQVVGTIAKGDRLVASNLPGVATALDMLQYQPGCIIGKAIETYNSLDVGVIEVVVGRL
jgi:hypothetical protein